MDGGPMWTIFGVPVVPVAVGTAGAIALYLFYRVLYTEWPNNYFHSTDRLAFTISQRRSRYLAFRFLPLAFVSALVAGLGEKFPHGPLVGVAALFIAHTALHIGQSLVASLRHKRGSVPLAGGRLWVLAAIGLTSGLAVASGYGLVVYAGLPTPSGTDIGTATVAALVAAFVITAARVLTADAQGSGDLLEHSRSQLGGEFEHAVSDIALENDVDPRLLVAIMHAENLQRPPWIRQLERAKTRIFRSGSTGVFQVNSPTVLSDVESARRAAASLHGLWPALRAYPRGDWEITEAAERHNPDRAFGELVASLYSETSLETVASSESEWDSDAMRGAGWRPPLVVSSLSRFRTVATLRGETDARCGDLEVHYRMPSGAEVEAAIELPNSAAHRSGWSIDLPFDFQDARIFAPACQESHVHDLTLT